MPKLTKEQIRLLIWLSQPETVFEVSREDGFMDDKYNGLHTFINPEGLRYKFDIRTLYRLEGEKLIGGNYVYHFGIMWERYTLSQAGQVYVSMLAISK
jgi:hypothetical protein